MTRIILILLGLATAGCLTKPTEPANLCVRGPGDLGYELSDGTVVEWGGTGGGGDYSDRSTAR